MGLAEGSTKQAIAIVGDLGEEWICPRTGGRYGNDKTVDQSGVYTLSADQVHQMVTAVATDDPENDPAPQDMTVDDVWLPVSSILADA